MQQFLIIWYSGCLTQISNVISSKIVEAESIDMVDFMSILPNEIIKHSYYQRIILTEENIRDIDYGSYTKFIRIIKK